MTLAGAPGPPGNAPRLLIILGPTGTGKSEIALELARRIDAEIVGCDALQVYRQFDLGTAKPTPAERARVPHHLVDHVEPTVDYSLADFVRDADAAIAAIHSRGRVPLVVGGTGMYLRGLLRGIIDAPARDVRIRERLRRMASRFGAGRLHRWLRSLDAVTATRLSVGDTQRIVRALEVVLVGGGSLEGRIRRDGTWKSGNERYRSLKIGLRMDPAELVPRLERRVERFLENGWVDEVRGLLDRGIPPGANAFKAIGYREILNAVQRGEDPSVMVERIKINTRRFAKRQATWFRKESDVVWLDSSIGRDARVATILRRWADPRTLP